jgi:hypothetical protein
MQYHRFATVYRPFGLVLVQYFTIKHVGLPRGGPTRHTVPCKYCNGIWKIPMKNIERLKVTVTNLPPLSRVGRRIPVHFLLESKRYSGDRET